VDQEQPQQPQQQQQQQQQQQEITQWVGHIIHLCGVVMAADGGEHRKQTSQQQDLCRRTIGAPRIAEAARATRPTATHQGTQPGSQAQVEKHMATAATAAATKATATTITV